MLYSFFWVIPRRLNFMCRRFGTLYPIFVGGVNRKNNRDEAARVFKQVLLVILPTYTTYEDETECSETSAYKIQTPGNHPKRRTQYSEHGDILKSRKYIINHHHRHRLLRSVLVHNCIRLGLLQMTASIYMSLEG
jgi:hypothetical protein